MSGTEECQSTLPEAHIVRSISCDRDAQKGQSDIDNGNEMMKEPDEKVEENLNINRYLLAKSSLSATDADIMDSEISSIASKEGIAFGHNSSCNDVNENEERSSDGTVFSGRFSNDSETAALSPSFPLIRDKEESEMPTTEEEVGPDIYEDLSIEQNAFTKHSSLVVENTLDCSTIEPKIEEESSNLLEQVDMIRKEAAYNGDRKKFSNESDCVSQIYEENKDTEGVSCKENIVSSSVDRNNDVCNEKESEPLAADICDSSRESIKDLENSGNMLEKTLIESEQNDEGLSDGEINENSELSGDLSFASSVEEEEDKEPTPYNEISENIYLIDKKKTRLNKEIRRIRCDCTYEPDESGFVGCGANCLNRLLMIECGSKCNCGEFCTNKSFQKGCVYNLEVFQAGKKGLGVRTKDSIEQGAFIIEYCGEVVNYKEFMERTEKYDEEKRRHYYFMLLKGDEVIDATRCGSISRFINHSCDPNCVTQKWTVNGFLRVGFFSLREIKPGEELTFDYQYQRYGEKAQKCFCGSENCRGVIGGKQMVLKPSGSNGETSKKRSKKKAVDYPSDYKLEDDLLELLGEQGKISTSKQALELTRLMVKTETIDDRCTLLGIVRDQSESKALKAFIRYKGLSLLWSWMVDTPSKDQNFRAKVLSTLKILPIPNKNHLVDSKILPLVEKWSRLHDSPDSIRSDEEGSSSENEAAAAAAAAKAATAESGKDTKSEKGELDKSTKEERRKCSSDVKGASTDDESDNSEKYEEVGSMANELLNRWKGLREVYKIPKKTQLTPEHSKPVPDASASPLEEKRFGKRKIESPSSSSNKRLFAAQIVSSPIRPLVQDSPIVSSFSPTPTQSSTTSSSGKTHTGDADSSSSDAFSTPRTMLTQQIAEITGKGACYRSQPRNMHEEEKPLQSYSRLERGINSLSWRSNPQFHDDFGGNQNKKFRGGRIGRGKQRLRGKGNFSSFGHHKQQQQQQFNDRKEWPSNSSNPYSPKDTNSFPVRDFNEGNFNAQNLRPFPENNRMPSPYQVPPPPQSLRERSKDFGPSDAVHFERQDLIHGEQHDGIAHRFNPIRLSSPHCNRFGQPGQDWQQSPGQNHPFTPFPGQAQQGFNPPRLQGNASAPPRMPANHPPQQFGVVPSTSVNIANQSNVPMHNWNQNWPPAPPQQGFPPPPSLPPQRLPNQNMNPIAVVGQGPAIANTNPVPPPPFSMSPQQRLPGQPALQQIQQHQQHQQQIRPFLDVPQQPNFGQLPPKPIRAETVPEPGPSTPASIIKHLHDLAQKSRLVERQKLAEEAEQQKLQQQQQQQQQHDHQQHLQQQHQVDHSMDYGNRTPETATDSGIISVTPIKSSINDNVRTASDQPTYSKTISSLPPNWKTATDPEGKVYYYHVITRKTQWEIPTWEEEEDIPTQDLSQRQYSGPRTPNASPPHSPISPPVLPQRAPAISDPSVSTTRMSNTVGAPSEQLTPKQQKMRDHFKTKLSAVVVNCLNPYQKVDCKQARIAKVDDFKFLARKLTHGLMMKELARVKTDEELECNDSVKIKVKEYIRNYMKKFGQFYIRS